MADTLKALRLSRKIPAKDMVEAVREIYPKYDKTVQSKCENGDTYGVDLRPDAMKLLYSRFAPEALEAKEARKRDRHRFPCRISARLQKADYDLLQQLIKADGYASVQDWLADVVRDRIKKAGDFV